MGLSFITELKSEQKFFKNIYVKDFLIIVLFFMFGLIFRNMIHPMLSYWFLAYNVLVGIIITRKAVFTNPKKRLYEAAYIYLIKDKSVYKPIILERKEPNGSNDQEK